MRHVSFTQDGAGSAEVIMAGEPHDVIRIRGARQNSLKNLDLDIPKRRLIVATGVSGSGKSSLVFDTIAAESARQLNETFSAFAQGRLPSYAHPDVDSLENLSAVIVVDQKRLSGGPRSTVGTISDIGARLRLLFSRLGDPSAGYSHAYSFNDPLGMCPSCQGLGIAPLVLEAELIEETRSLNEGAIRFPAFNPGTWLWKAYAKSGFFDPDKKIRDYTQKEKRLFLHAPAGRFKPPAGMDAVGTAYEGLITRFSRLYLQREPESFKGAQRTAFERIVVRGKCQECGGTRLAAPARASLIRGKSIADHNAMQISDLIREIDSISDLAVAPLVESLKTHLNRMMTLGLGYLSLDRATSTLSGGEAQRIKMVRHLGSALTDMLYVFDEPTVGLHPRDVKALGQMLLALRDRGNTVIVVEHDPDIMAIADHLIDLGPGAGKAGGHVIYQGDYAGLARADTPTGLGLRMPRSTNRTPRMPTGWIPIIDATTNNLKHVNTRFPLGVMTVVTGVAGSGKSSLVLGHLPTAHPDTTVIDQRPIHGSRRSNPATFTGLLDLVRDLFAKATKQPAGLFTPNSTGGCPACEGNGVIYTDLAFMEGVVTRCEVCDGRRFTSEAQKHKVANRSIADVFEMSVDEALDYFSQPAIRDVLNRLRDVGLHYLTLGQDLTSLSGGERQRLKLAANLASPGGTIVLDEPTTGLHIADIQKLIDLLNRMVEAGATLIVIEHNLDVISAADWIIDIGPEAGRDGGAVVYEGTLKDLLAQGKSHTAAHLRRYCETVPGHRKSEAADAGIGEAGR
ncbi:ATP-binding cassette domain-containing protein [Pseudomonas aeruginosa]|uniref:ATP-binding cassette domain-containing protein n=1 Tax=Pseudomonas aeruginosa TaxID=287 RepID=UPI001F29FFB5|nr:excinuclease ABC subunit UvrA [Pseudomonas aeruginosa]MCG0435149.1 excinuclease ABC subunit UvrA [Pseudomonas aeruginosa]